MPIPDAPPGSLTDQHREYLEATLRQIGEPSAYVWLDDEEGPIRAHGRHADRIASVEVYEPMLDDVLTARVVGHRIAYLLKLTSDALPSPAR